MITRTIAMPKRRLGQAEDVQLQTLPCLIACGHAIPLPTVVEDTVKCVALNCSAKWLNNVVSGRNRDDDAFQVVKRFATEFLDALASTEAVAPIADEVPADSTRTDGPKVGRDALGLDDDSEEEEVAARPPSKARRTVKKRRDDFRTICFRGMELTAKPRIHMRSGGKGVLVPVEGESLLNIVRHLRELLLTGGHREDGCELARGRREPPKLPDDADRGRIRWMFAKGSYQIIFTDDTGKLRQSCKGLGVAREDHMGKPLSPESYRLAREAMLNRARKSWNAYDHSSAERFAVKKDE